MDYYWLESGFLKIELSVTQSHTQSRVASSLTEQIYATLAWHGLKMLTEDESSSLIIAKGLIVRMPSRALIQRRAVVGELSNTSPLQESRERYHSIALDFLVHV